MTTSEKIRSAIYAVLPLFVVYGLVSEQEAALWGAAVWSVASTLLAIFHVGEPGFRFRDLDAD